jgi:hypothetical protein
MCRPYTVPQRSHASSVMWEKVTVARASMRCANTIRSWQSKSSGKTWQYAPGVFIPYGDMLVYALPKAEWWKQRKMGE